MATLISAETMQGSGEGVRASVNNHYFVEAETLTGTGAMPSAKIRSGVGAGIVTIDSWTPAENDFNVEPQHSVEVNAHAHADSNEKSILYDDGTDGDPWSNGTLDDVSPTLDGIQLGLDAPAPDFSTYENNYLHDASQPENWTYLGHALGWVASPTDGWAYNNVTGDHSHSRYDDGGQPDNGELLAKFYVPGTPGDYAGFNMWTRGAGSALAGYQVVMQMSGAYTLMRRMYSDTSTYGGGGTITFGTPDTSTWYWLKVKFQKDATLKHWWAKRWKDGDAEPASYTYGGNDTFDVASSGYVGLTNIKGYSRVSDFQIIPDPAAYVLSGDWESGELDTTDIEQYSNALVSWDETTPTDTAVAVKARWRTGGTWLACTNGTVIPGITAGETTVAGSSKDSLEFRVELSTTDNTVTPLCENLLFDHQPLNPAGVEIEVDGHSATVANGALDVWGIRQIIAGVNDEAWDDVSFRTFLPWYLSNANAVITADFKYGGFTIGSVHYQIVNHRWMTSDDLLQAYFSLQPIKYASAPVEVRWNAQEGWAPMSHVYGWVLIDYSMGMHRDLAYLVGHYQIDDQPSSLLVAELAINDHPGSLLTKGYKLDDHIASLLVQGPQLDDHFGMVMPAIRTFSDAVGSVITGVAAINDHPGQYLVYGVNRDGAVFVNVIDDTTHAKLVAEGIVFS